MRRLLPCRLLPDDEDEPEELPESSESEDEPRSLAEGMSRHSNFRSSMSAMVKWCPAVGQSSTIGQALRVCLQAVAREPN
mmetsp:Transcript_66304/g.134718  ORF Transcript_66304/g.134718 Transcript_66304/m.134718 type:complete len:80 (+) Transcript_66304:1989-2228(+)